MRPSSTITHLAAALAALIIAPAALAQSASADGSSAAAAAAQDESAPSAAESEKLDEQLAAARRRLEEAARQVAELSAERGRTVMRRYSRLFARPGRAIIGVQLDAAGGKDGARVLDVSPGGPAAEAGIRAGDVITAVNGRQVRGGDAAREVVRAMRDLKPDSKVHVEVLRDGKPLAFTVTPRREPGLARFAGGAPPAPPAPPFPPFGRRPPPRPLLLMQGPLADMELATLTPRLGSYFGTDKGVLVVRAPADGALGLEDGDVILSIDGRTPTSGAHATRILASYQPGERITLEIMRQRKPRKIATTMPADALGGRRARFRYRGEPDALPRPHGVLILRGERAPASI